MSAPALAGRVEAVPFAAGSVAIKPYLHDELPVEDRLSELFRQAALIDQAGFDGLVLSEHHANVMPGYQPVPTSVIGWILARTSRLWAAPCPTLLLLRPTLLVAEELAWLAAAFPGRVGAAFAAGSPGVEFAIARAPSDNLAARFERELTAAATVLGTAADVPGAAAGGENGALRDDAAVGRLACHPLPLLSAASSSVAARRAARSGVGLLLDAEITVELAAHRIGVYREAGGPGPEVLTRKVWIGDLPRALIERQQEFYRRRASERGRPFTVRSAEDTEIIGGDADNVASRLREVLSAVGARAAILQVHLPGVSPAVVRGQILRIGVEVLPGIRGTFGQRRGTR
jgi:alkanesulfonate monooxygenase SsuD/methylene tetrahydromethanopterin reductase-like flavin-dependent oxidoreductase (luciferase family)